MEHGVLKHADIDTRRALGVYRRLPKSEFVPRPIPPVSFRYWPEKKTIVYTDFSPDCYEMTVYHNITRQGPRWSPCEIWSIWLNNRGEYDYSFTFADTPFYFAGKPIVVRKPLT